MNFLKQWGKRLITNKLFEVMLNKALEADPDGGGLLSYGYFSGENITGLEKGRPLFVRSPESQFQSSKLHADTSFYSIWCIENRNGYFDQRGKNCNR